jgi:pimeloyl-ACP methyl ester carboxylesterase
VVARELVDAVDGPVPGGGLCAVGAGLAWRAGHGGGSPRWTVPSPGKPLFEAAAANFSPHSPAKVNTGNKTRGPLLLIAGGHDHTVPAAITRSTRKLYHKSPAITDQREFNDRGHSLTMDHGWREIADEVLSWLSQRVK